jgi:hypothetical protein
MSLDGLEPADAFIVEKAQIRDESLVDKGPKPISEAGCDHVPVAIHLLLSEFAILALFKLRFSAHDLVIDGLLPIGFGLQCTDAHQV